LINLDITSAYEFLDDAGVPVEMDYSLAAFCTYKVGGNADLFAEANDVDELIEISKAIKQFNLPVLVLGKGSNLLLSNSGFRGIVVKLDSGFDFVDIDGDVVIAGGITFLPIVARKSAAASLTGFEWAVGVPGSIGGAVRMNAGGHGSDMAQSLVSADIFDFDSSEFSVMTPKDLELSYRSSNLISNQIVTSATFKLAAGDKEKSEAEISSIVKWRREHQPGGQNAGSVFANPEGNHAAKLIDDCGLKGFRIGSAEVSNKHANFIQADANGNPDDVYLLIQKIQLEVFEQTGINLHPENKLIGFD